MKKGFELEKMYEIWNNDFGSCLQVGPDRDCLDLLEIRSISPEGKVEVIVSFTKDEGALIFKALGDLLNLTNKE